MFLLLSLLILSSDKGYSPAQFCTLKHVGTDLSSSAAA